MFTVNIYLRFALIAILLIGGTTLSFMYGFWYAFPFLLTGLLLLLGYILLGTVQSAAQMVQEMKFDEAEKRLSLILKPEWLYTTNRAFFYMIKGTLAMQRKNNEEAEIWLTKAQNQKLPSDNERAMVYLQLANIHGMKNRWNQAKVLFRSIKKFNVTEPQIKEQIREFEKALANKGMMSVANRGGKSGGVFRPGGKRKRPKMR